MPQTAPQTAPLTDALCDALRTGDVVRAAAPELAGDVLMILAMPGESTEQVLEETLADLREKRGWAELRRRANVAWAKENAD